MSTVAGGQDWHPCHRPGMAAAHAPCWAKSTSSEDEAQLPFENPTVFRAVFQFVMSCIEVVRM